MPFTKDCQVLIPWRSKMGHLPYCTPIENLFSCKQKMKISYWLLFLINILLFFPSLAQEAIPDLEELDDYDELEAEPYNPYLEADYQRILKVVLIDYANNFSNLKGQEKAPDPNALFPRTEYETMAVLPFAEEAVIVERSSGLGYRCTLMRALSFEVGDRVYENFKEMLATASLPCGKLTAIEQKDPNAKLKMFTCEFHPHPLYTPISAYENIVIRLTLIEMSNYDLETRESQTTYDVAVHIGTRKK